MGTSDTLVYISALAIFAYIFVPSLWLFLFGVESGMDHIDRMYPYPQARKPLHDHPVLIYTHMYANIIALGIQLSLLRFHPPIISKTIHRRLAWTYTLLVIPGTLASMFYASHQNYGNDGGKSGTFAFAMMAFATLSTLATSLYCIYIRRDARLHREWSIRNFAVLFGNGIFFRILANTYLVYMARWGADRYSAWCEMIYLSWLVPLFVAEQYLAWERARWHNTWSGFEQGRQSGKINRSESDCSLSNGIEPLRLHSVSKLFATEPLPRDIAANLLPEASKT